MEDGLINDFMIPKDKNVKIVSIKKVDGTPVFEVNPYYTCTKCGKTYKDDTPNNGSITCSRCGKHWELCYECREMYGVTCPACGGRCSTPWTNPDGSRNNMLY